MGTPHTSRNQGKILKFHSIERLNLDENDNDLPVKILEETGNSQLMTAPTKTKNKTENHILDKRDQ